MKNAFPIEDSYLVQRRSLYCKKRSTFEPAVQIKDFATSTEDEDQAFLRHFECPSAATTATLATATSTASTVAACEAETSPKTTDKMQGTIQQARLGEFHLPSTEERADALAQGQDDRARFLAADDGRITVNSLETTVLLLSSRLEEITDNQIYRHFNSSKELTKITRTDDFIVLEYLFFIFCSFFSVLFLFLSFFLSDYDIFY